MQIEWQIKSADPRFLLISIDGEPWKEIYKSLIAKHLSFLRDSATQEELKERFALIEAKIAKEAALRLLASRGQLSTEIHKKLALKGLSFASIEKALDDCRRLGVLDDRHEAHAFIAREEAKGNGPHLIAYKLKLKGIKVSPALMQKMQDNQKNVLKKLLQKPKYRDEPRKLIRRGFDASLF